MSIVVFEDEAWTRFAPLTYFRHTCHLRYGTKTLIDSIVGIHPNAEDVILWGREEMADSVRASGRKYNTEPESAALFLNARANPSKVLSLLSSTKATFVASFNGQLVAAKLDGRNLKPGLIKKRDVKKLEKTAERLEASKDMLFSGYWEIIKGNGLAIAEQARPFSDPLNIPQSAEVLGSASNIHIANTAHLGRYVTLDARLGPIIVESHASIESFSTLTGPIYIGPKTRVSSAVVERGSSIFEYCRVGGQIKNSIFMPYTSKAHHGYVGDSYVGEWVNLGAGSTFSNLKNTLGNVRVVIEGEKVETGMFKLGPIVGDLCKVSIGALVYGGKSLGTASHLSGLAKANIPSFTYFDGDSGKMVELRLDSVIEIQRRLMEAKGLQINADFEGLIRYAFRATSVERRKAGVSRGQIS